MPQFKSSYSNFQVTGETTSRASNLIDGNIIITKNNMLVDGGTSLSGITNSINNIGNNLNYLPLSGGSVNYLNVNGNITGTTYYSGSTRLQDIFLTNNNFTNYSGNTTTSLNNKVSKGGDSNGVPLMIGTNDVQSLQLETSSVTRIMIDALGTTNVYGNVVISGTTGQTISVPTLRVLDFDGTYRTALDKGTSGNRLNLGTDFGTLIILPTSVNYNNATVIGINTLVTNNILPTGTSILKISTQDQTTNINTPNLTFLTGGNTLTTTSGKTSGSILIDVGAFSSLSANTRGGVSIFNGTSSPNWNGLQRGMYIGNATSIPTSIPTNGSFFYTINGELTKYDSTGRNGVIAVTNNETFSGNTRIGNTSLTTTSTDGFPYIPLISGINSVTPTSLSSFAPMYVDATNNRLYVYVNGAWKYSALI